MFLLAPDSKQRFSNRVDDYVRYRPSYPRAILRTLIAECGLTPEWRIADVGSGTGKLAELFLDNGNRVYAVEPNENMRRAAESLLGNNPNFNAVPGSAEATTLRLASVDVVAAGQAFHWFDRTAAKAEFLRILKASGWMVLVWNERRDDTTPFLKAYEELLRRYSRDYTRVDHRNITEEILQEFFSPSTYRKRVFEKTQDFDREGLLGRLRSSSYVPAPGEPNHEVIVRDAEALFKKYAENGRVRFEYSTVMYFAPFRKV
ncbi:MAG TPA: class I SAM-dependent methyltransferase [Terriglobales bacterium]|nr:class I SAM-dependent methyltransferase [Terriglobales bacterium]